MRLVYFDCVGGISGDMTLGALVAAGWSEASLASVPARLRLPAVRVETSQVRRGVFAATKVDVIVESDLRPHRHLHHIEAIYAAADLPAVVRDRALAVFRRLAEAEAHVHGTTVAKVHFHEVGAEDALVDITGALLGLHELGVERVFCSALPLGGGDVDSEHGRIPIPAPATALLLQGVPVRPSRVMAEQVTPTGAALVQELVHDWGEVAPAYRLDRVGVGAGTRDDPESPNILRVFLGQTDSVGSALLREEVSVLETAVDDENPQSLAALTQRLLAQGALDCWVVPALMKKGRMGSWLVVIAKMDAADALATTILTHSTTLGIRIRQERRLTLPRACRTVHTEFGEIELKLATLPDGSTRAVPEFESLAAAAAVSGASLREIANSAQAAWRSESVPNSPSPSKKTD